MKIGPWALRSVEAGRMKLDGGAMFGTVPKAIWNREHPADPENRIVLACRLLFADDGEHRVLVDTGMGDKWSEKEREIYGVAPDYPPLETALRRAGIDPDSVTDLVLTHLHFDHAGGATRRDESGELVAAFPKARHWVQRRNLDNARSPNPRERASYRPENFEPLLATDLRLLEGETEILPGLRVFPSDGHTCGMQLVEFHDGAKSLTYCADLVPTASHVHPAYTMGYDINAGLLIEEKARVLERCREGWRYLYFEHEPRGAAGRPVFDGKRVSIADIIEIEEIA